MTLASLSTPAGPAVAERAGAATPERPVPGGGAALAVLRLTGLRKELVSPAHRFDLEIEELTLERGGFYGLVGKSGSGKSTLLDMLAMVSQPSAVEAFELYAAGGVVDVAGLLARADDRGMCTVRLACVGYVLQSGGLFEFLSVRQNLELPARMSGRAVTREGTRALAATFEMEEHLDKFPSQLSGGQRQRVSILRALSLAPPLILADEPTASVDENMADLIVARLRSLARRRGSTVLMVSHDLDLIGSHADAVLHLRAEPVGAAHTRSRLMAGEGAAR